MDTKTKSARGGARTPGPGKRLGRPRTSKGWATISLRVPAADREKWNTLEEAVRDRARGEMRAAFERALQPREE